MGGIDIGSSVAAAAKTYGMPATVTSSDSGHLWTWHTPHAELKVTTDDDAIVRAVDERPLDEGEAIVVSIDGKPARIKLLGYTVAEADRQLSSLAAFSSSSVRVYNLTLARQLVFFFDSGTLTHAIYGEHGAIAQMGVLAADAELLRNQKYYAPRLRGSQSPSPGGSHETIVRSQIGTDGLVQSVQVTVSSSDPVADARALQIAKATRWMPAKYLAVPVPAVVFRMIGT